MQHARIFSLAFCFRRFIISFIFSLIYLSFPDANRGISIPWEHALDNDACMRQSMIIMTDKSVITTHE